MRSRRVAMSIVAGAFTLTAATPMVWAQEGEPAGEAAAPQETASEQKNSALVEKAEAAETAGKWEEALKAWEGAYREEQDALYVWRRILIYHKLKRPEPGLQLISKFRGPLKAHEKINGLNQLEQELLAEKARQDQAKQDPKVEPSSTPWWAWVSGGAGLALAGVGTFFLVDALGLANEVRCAQAFEDVDAEDCAGIARPRYADQTELDDARGAVNLRWGLGWGLIGVGAAGLGLGIYGLVAGGEPKAESNATGWNLMLSPSSVGFQARW